MTRKRTRKPANEVEAQALDTWRDARPFTAMYALARAGYDRDAQAKFLAEVVGLADEDIPGYVNGIEVIRSH